VRSETGGSVDLAYGNQGYGDERAANAARKHGIELEAVKLPEARRGFVLLPRRWVIERSFAWTTRLRRRVEDCERYASTLADLHLRHAQASSFTGSECLRCAGPAPEWN
jgi:hypothetical protein